MAHQNGEPFFYRLRVKSGNSSAASAVSARIKRRRASSTFRSFFFIAGRFFLVTLRFVSDGRPSAACRRFGPA
jgi:hypothetical protein